MATVVAKTIEGYGPYLYHIEWQGSSQQWEYLGKASETNVHDAIADEGLTPVDDENVPDVDGEETERNEVEPVGDEFSNSVSLEDYAAIESPPDGEFEFEKAGEDWVLAPTGDGYRLETPSGEEFEVDALDKTVFDEVEIRLRNQDETFEFGGEEYGSITLTDETEEISNFISSKNNEIRQWKERGEEWVSKQTPLEVRAVERSGRTRSGTKKTGKELEKNKEVDEMTPEERARWDAIKENLYSSELESTENHRQANIGHVSEEIDDGGVYRADDLTDGVIDDSDDIDERVDEYREKNRINEMKSAVSVKGTESYRSEGAADKQIKDVQIETDDGAKDATVTKQYGVKNVSSDADLTDEEREAIKKGTKFR